VRAQSRAKEGKEKGKKKEKEEGHKQGGGAVRGGLFVRGPALEQEAEHLSGVVAPSRSEVQRRAAEKVFQIDVRAVADEEACRFNEIVEDGVEQQGPGIVVASLGCVRGGEQLQ